MTAAKGKMPWQAANVQEAIAILADMDPVTYEQHREGAAEEWDVRVSALDKFVAEARKKSDADGEDIFGWTVKPAPVPIDTARLLTEIEHTINTYVVMPKASATAAALWTAVAWIFDRFDTSPLLTLTSPEKRCGKTTLLGCITALVPRPMPASNITAAALFRAVEAWRPTLLIDEADSFIGNNEELRGVVNSGHTRWSAYVIRTVETKGEHTPQRFSTWCPKVVALIGKLPDTLQDRSIVIPMKRKAPGETVKKLRDPMADDGLDMLRRSLCRWAADDGGKIEAANVQMVDGLNDRAADNWRPLLAIADMAGGDWPAKARAAALALSGDDIADTDSTRTTLLADIRSIFGDRDRMTSDAIVARLAMMDDRRWPEWKAGKSMTKVQLARMLAPFGITSRTIRMDDGTTPKGYYRAFFDDAFARYLPSETPHRHDPHPISTSGENSKRHKEECGVSENAQKPASNGHCGGVADQNPPGGDEYDNAGFEVDADGNAVWEANP